MTIKILVIDHDGRIQAMLKDTLTPLECQIIPASSTALAVFLARKNFPSLIVHNISAEGEECELAQEIANDTELAHIPVVVLIPPEQLHIDAKIRAAGAKRIMPAPDDGETLRNLLVPFLIEQEDDREKETTE